MKIAIDAGHGLYTSGKRCLTSIDPNETREWTLNSRIASRVVEHLERCGVDTLRLDDVTGKTDVPLATRTGKANAWGADWCISIHHNAGIKGGSGGGPVVFVYSGKHSAKSDRLQQAVYDALIGAVGKFGNRSNPLASANLHMVRQTNMPAVLVEVGFMDSTVDTPLILDPDWAEKAAGGIARGICAAAGIAWVEESAPVPAFAPYLVRITAKTLNVRSGPGVTYDVATTVKQGDVYTIVGEAYNGPTLWGRLKSGAGWISLAYTEPI